MYVCFSLLLVEGKNSSTNRQLAGGRKFSSRVERNEATPDFSSSSVRFAQSFANSSRDRELQRVVAGPSEHDIEAIEGLKLMAVSRDEHVYPCRSWCEGSSPWIRVSWLILNRINRLGELFGKDTMRMC